MENEDLEIIDSQNDNEQEVEVVEVAEEESEEPEEYSEREKQYYARIKKLEQELKEKDVVKPEVVKKANSDNKLSTFDLLALQKANIETEEDLDEVTRWAGYNNITVAEALKSEVLKTVLANNTEVRRSAMAVNTGTTRRAGNGSISDDRLMADAQKGIMPESSDDIGRLARLRLQNR